MGVYGAFYEQRGGTVESAASTFLVDGEAGKIDPTYRELDRRSRVIGSYCNSPK
jgi:hypothetical protein